MPERPVSFRAADGSALAGLWRTPAGEGPFACVLCVHGLTLTKSLFDEAAGVLEGRGLASLRVDLRGHGDSGGLLRDQGFEDQLADVRAAFGALAGLPEADPDRRALLGFSMGAAMGVVAAGTLPLRALVLWSPLLKTGLWNGLRRDQYGPPQGNLRPIWDGILVQERLFSEASVYDPLALASAWPGPLLVCHGGKDRNHPPSAAFEAVSARVAAALPTASYFPPLSGHRWLAEPERRLRDSLSAAFLEASL